MEFWGIEVKPGESVNCEVDGDRLLHISQAALGESKGKGNENVPIFLKVDDMKLVIGTLSAEKCTQIPFDLVFDQDFELSHSSKNTSVYFCGYTRVTQELDDDEYPDSESEPEEVAVGQNANGHANAVKKDDASPKKAKKAEPVKADKPKPGTEDEDDSDDEDDEFDASDSDEEMVDGMTDSDDEDEDDSSDEDEATPKKPASGKRPAESASKTPVPEKKAKVVTPAGGQKTGDGKKGGHVATPHPAKKAGKTPANDKSNQKSPKSAGSITCKSCSKTFNSDNALQAHTKAKHG